MNDYLNQIKTSAQLLNERNQYLSRKGQTDSLYESIQTYLALTHCCSEQPFMIDYLVMLALEAMVAHSLEDSLNFSNFSDEQLSALHRKFCQMRQTDIFGSAMITRRVVTIELFNLPVSEQTKQIFVPAPLFYLYSFSGIKKKDSIKILDCYEDLINAADLTSSDQLKRIDEIFNAFDANFAGFFSLSPETSNGKIINIAARVTGNLLCAETALAIERYRLKYKTLPDSLDQLVGEFIVEVPIDPFDSKPIRYCKLENSGYILYSIGEDRKDNNGLDKVQMKEKTGEKYAKEYDWPFTVKRNQNHKN